MTSQDTIRSFSLGRKGEGEWERLRATYVLSGDNGEIVLVAADSVEVRDEVRRRLGEMTSALKKVEPAKGVTMAIHAHAQANNASATVPVMWIEAPREAPPPGQDIQWAEALTVLNQTRDALQMHGPCHVVLAGPRDLYSVVTRSAPDLSSFMRLVLLLDDTLDQLRQAPRSLTWMHLSDLHVSNENWQQDRVLDALVRDLPGLLEQRSLQPELLFVTGDVANRAKPAEYDGAYVVLEKVTETLGIERTQHVFMVPGNHDVDRAAINSMVTRHHAALVGLGTDELRDEVGELVGSAEQFTLYGKRLAPWCAFTKNFLGLARSVDPSRPWRSDVVELGGLKVGVLSLCTAWASGADDASGRLILGERQLQELVAEAKDGGAQLTIALMHHPLRWLLEGEYSALRGLLEREVDVVLHGHVHDAHSAASVAAGSSHAVLGAGAAYARLGQDRYHGFSVGRLDFEAGKLHVHHFTWSTRSGKWHGDTGAPGADDTGRAVLSLSPAGLTAAVAAERTASGLEVLAVRLRRAAARVYSACDFAGLGAIGPGKTVTLEQIFVPLQFSATRLDQADPTWFATESEPKPSNAKIVTLSGLEAMLGTGRHVVVLGDPGSGKSTLSKYLASTMAQPGGARVPLLLTVREWIAQGKHEGLLEMAARQATSVLQVPTSAETLERLCNSDRVLLIIDGIDEAADPAVRRDLRDRLHAFVANHPGVPVLATSRVVGYHDVPLDHGFAELALEPFDDEAIRDFVHRWYDLVEDNPAERLRKRVDLLGALEAEPRAKALARNPLLATLIGMVHFSHARLPGERAKLYAMMVDLLLVNWPAQRGRTLPLLPGTAQVAMLEAVALKLQKQRAGSERGSQGEVLVGRKEFEGMLAEQLAQRSPNEKMHAHQDLAQQWCRWLLRDSGLLQEQRPGQLSFLHLSLMEYMAGQALRRSLLKTGYEGVAEQVALWHDKPVWRETLLLMLGRDNENQELGQVVVERLLRDQKDGAGPKWSACVFGLGMLREEVHMGDGMRERLLDATCRAAIDVTPYEWKRASGQLADVLRFGKTHAAPARAWLERELANSTGERLCGALAMGCDALAWEDIATVLGARNDESNLALTLLEFGNGHRAGKWARKHANREIWAAWANATPLQGVFWRSVESVEHGDLGGIWVAPLLARIGWVAKALQSSAQELRTQQRHRGKYGLPARLSWSLDLDVTASVRLDPAVSGPHRAIHRGFSRYFSQYFFREFSREFSQSLPIDISRNFPRGLPIDFVRKFSESFSRDFPRHIPRYSYRDFSRYFSQKFCRNFPGDIAVTLSLEHPPNLHENLDTPAQRRSSLLEQLRRADSEPDASAAALALTWTIVAEAHAAVVTSAGLKPRGDAAPLANLRIENRWLNIFFTPLVEHATRSRPLPQHPHLHALLLTYGLIQYQTTWQWPDCPHWRAWMSGPAPEHWLPAHVWHLVRSIEDPDDPTHGQRASACLDRNDWPQLAADLRECVVLPTPPEILALFDRGRLPDNPQTSTE